MISRFDLLCKRNCLVLLLIYTFGVLGCESDGNVDDGESSLGSVSMHLSSVSRPTQSGMAHNAPGVLDLPYLELFEGKSILWKINSVVGDWHSSWDYLYISQSGHLIFIDVEPVLHKSIVFIASEDLSIRFSDEGNKYLAHLAYHAESMTMVFECFDDRGERIVLFCEAVNEKEELFGE